MIPTPATPLAEIEAMEAESAGSCDINRMGFRRMVPADTLDRALQIAREALAEVERLTLKCEAFNNIAASWGAQGEGQMLRAEAAEAKAQAFQQKCERLAGALREIAAAEGRILTGSPGPLFDAGFSNGVAHQANRARTALADGDGKGAGK